MQKNKKKDTTAQYISQLGLGGHKKEGGCLNIKDETFTWDRAQEGGC